ncbi:MAG: hypothetical protein K2K54_05880 [Lachnospiraceae bacterium]|nr:hypothetical protein [Lachnospiraceae bacterium]
MLRKMKDSEFEQYVDVAYELALELPHSGFPVYADGVKTKEDFINRSRMGLCSEEEEILLFEYQGNVQGWIHYYYIRENRYLGVSSILIRDGYERALEELLQYWNTKFPGYTWSLYFPEENTEALDFMKKRGCQDRGQEAVNVLLFENYSVKEESSAVIPIGLQNFELFRKLHGSFEEEMYWTSDRIEATIDNWGIFAYVEGESSRGVLYYNRQTPRMLEIFGIDVHDGADASVIVEKLLISCLNRAKEEHAESMYFFNDRFPNEIMEALGFHHITTAHYFES